MRTAPPEPTREKVSGFSGQELVEVIYSPSGWGRGIITVDATGIYRVRTEYWDTSDWEIAGVVFWSESPRGTSLVDSVETARQITHEYFANERHEKPNKPAEPTCGCGPRG